MIRANYVSVAASFFVIIGFLIAIPHDLEQSALAAPGGIREPR
jgi:hypothetical protein